MFYDLLNSPLWQNVASGLLANTIFTLLLSLLSAPMISSFKEFAQEAWNRRRVRMWVTTPLFFFVMLLAIRFNSTSSGLMTGYCGLPDTQRQAFAKALYALAVPRGYGRSEIKIFAEARNELCAQALAGSFMIAGWKPAPDSAGGYVLRPDFNIAEGITIRSDPGIATAHNILIEAFHRANISIKEERTLPPNGGIQVEVGDLR